MSKHTATLIMLVSLSITFSWMTGIQRGEQPASVVTITPTPPPNVLPTSLPYNGPIPNGNKTNLPSGLVTNVPIRGTLNDHWADVIIGQPDFGQITPNQVVGNKLFNPGGVYVDRSVVPNRVYIYDAGNSRILGFSHLGTAQGGPESGQPCTSNSDHPESVCVIDPTQSADIVLGQDSFDSSTCNGDSAMQNYPALPAPSSSSICGINPQQVSILEGGSMATMATDSQGNFYFPDVFNNRVLRYNNPFSTDTVADNVWGQPDFGSGSCNRGASYYNPTIQSLCLAPTLGNGNMKTGVTIDSQGNLWVADTQNNRVVRFPYDPTLGVSSQTENLVLGQSNFTSATAGTALNQMTSPASVRVDSSGNVIVADGFAFFGAPGRILIFHPPLSNGMAASQIIQSGLGIPTSVELDPAGGFWVNDSDNQRVLHYDSNGNLLQTVSGVPSRIWGGIGIDRDSNLMLTGWDSQEVQVYSPPSYVWKSTFLQADQYGSFNQEGPRGLVDPGGMETAAGQLMVSDGPRLLFWNTSWKLTNNYPPADGVIGQPDFYTRPRWTPSYGRMRADDHGRLWVIKGYSFDNGITAEINAYQLPLTTGAAPILRITSPLPLKGGGTFTWSWSLIDGGIAYQSSCDCLWLSDRDDNRVFRISNVSTNPIVDIVLGQTDISGVHCNQGRDSDNNYIHPLYPTQDSLCAPGGLAFDRLGNLYVADHTLELAGNWRLLEFDTSTLPSAPSAAVFGISATRVFGRNGSFTASNCVSGDPMCGPWEPAFDLKNEMVVGFNGYLGPRFPMIYSNPLTNPLPTSSIMDFFSHPFSIRYDERENLYVLDLTRDRVLIYKATPPTFDDVPDTYWAYSWIERLYHAGITGGCSTNPLNYCPDNNVTRDQMAVFLERGMHGSRFNPLTVPLTFTDTAGDFAQYWIEALKTDGITSGCGTDLYCPTSPTTRAQMAIFLLKSEHGSSYTPPLTTRTRFTDVPASYWAASWIEQLANEGITSGCGLNTYCPDNPVTRAQMAVFLVKTFNLP